MEYLSDVTSENIINPFFAQYCTETELNLISMNSIYVDYKKGDIIFKQKTPSSSIIYLQDGLIKLYEDKSYNKLIYCIYKKNNFIDINSIMVEEMHQCSAAAIEDSKVQIISKGIFRKILFQNNNFALKILNVVCDMHSYINKRLLNAAQNQLNGRVAASLLYFSDVIYESEKFTIPLSRREFGEYVGTTRESITRILTDFKNDNIINYEGNDFEIINKKLLSRIKENG